MSIHRLHLLAFFALVGSITSTTALAQVKCGFKGPGQCTTGVIFFKKGDVYKFSATAPKEFSAELTVTRADLNQPLVIANFNGQIESHYTAQRDIWINATVKVTDNRCKNDQGLILRFFKSAPCKVKNLLHGEGAYFLPRTSVTVGYYDPKN